RASRLWTHCLPDRDGKGKPGHDNRFARPGKYTRIANVSGAFGLIRTAFLGPSRATVKMTGNRVNCGVWGDTSPLERGGNSARPLPPCPQMLEHAGGRKAVGGLDDRGLEVAQRIAGLRPDLAVGVALIEAALHQKLLQLERLVARQYTLV